MLRVVDASVVVKLFLLEEGTEAVEQLLHSEFLLMAPDLAAIEVANAVLSAARRQSVDATVALEVVHRLEEGRILLVPSRRFLARATEIALLLRHPIYDCLYLACAEERDAPLVTADRRFLQAVAGTAFADRVLLLGAP